MIKFDEQKFVKKYRGTERFVTEGNEYYRMFLELLSDETLLNYIKFANDVLRVPPIKTFIAYERDYLGKDVFARIMDAYEKKGLGACFGYLFTEMYGGYVSEQSWVNDEPTRIKTASYFIKTEEQ